jgi:hypothetical protein
MVANSKNQQFAVFCGLPRTGSTLLINLLMQNPNIHGEGASLLCELMWQTQQMCDKYKKGPRVCFAQPLLQRHRKADYNRKRQDVVPPRKRTNVAGEH